MADILSSLLQQVNDAILDAESLKIIGGQTKDGMLSRDVTGQPINLSEHSGIVHYDPTELVLTARAGTRISTINEELSRHKQRLPFEPPLFGEQATLGGSVATNLSGPNRPWAGAVRDVVLGIQMINGRGKVLRFGGQVMKNVAGYDVSRLQTGALGTLGILTEISIRVLPEPEYEKTCRWEMPPSEAIDYMNRLSGTPKPINAITWCNNHLYVRLSGAKDSVLDTLDKLNKTPMENAAQFWRDIKDQKHSFFLGGEPLWRLSVKSTAPMLLPYNDTMIDWGGALRWVKGHYSLEEVGNFSERSGGHAILFRGGDRSGEVRHSLSPSLKNIHKNLKHAFDPEHIFNRGAMYSWM